MKRVLANVEDAYIASYLNYVGDDSLVSSMIEEMKQLLVSVATPRVIYKQYVIKDGQPLQSRLKFTGKDIKILLEEAHHCLLWAGTLGAKVDQELRRLQLIDMGKAFVFDACANAAIEQVMDEALNEVAQQFVTQGLYCSDRFAPGYGDLPIALQSALIKEIDATHLIGLHVSDQNVLLPSKSITGVVGIANEVQPTILLGCAVCPRKQTCARREEGAYCGKKSG